MMMSGKLPRNAGTDSDSIALIGANHFMKCPVCAQWLDMRDLTQAAEHVHDGSAIEILEGPKSPREDPVH